MGRFNNYQSDLVYTPQTFEKLSILPMMLKKRQDDMEAQNDLIGINIANTKVAAGYQEAYDKKRQDFDNKSKDLAQRMASEGAGNPNLIKEFQNLKRQYNQDAAATGIMGAGAQRYKDDLEAERLYTQYGVDKSGQNADQVTKKWKEKYAKEQEGIRAGLAADPNYIAAPIVHEYAPKAVDTADFARKLQPFIGSDSKTTTTEKLRKLNGSVLRDETTGMLTVDTNSEMYKTNKNQVQGFVNLMNTQLLDSSSPLNQHLRYNDKDPKDYVKDIENIATMMRSTESASIDKENVIGGSGATTGAGPTGADDKGDVLLEKRTQRSPELEVKLPTYNGGSPVKLTGGNVRSIEQKMEQMEKAGDPLVQTKEYATQKQSVIDFKDSLREWDLAHAQETKEAFKKINREELQGGDKVPGTNITLKYNNYDDFIQKRKDARKYIEDHFQTIKGQGLGVPDVIKENVLDGFDTTTNNILQRARERTGNSNLMFNQNVYGVGFTDASAKMVEASAPYLKSQAKFLKEQLLDGSFGYAIDATGNQTPIDDMGMLNAEMADDIRVSSIATKNAKGVPSVGIEMTFGTGENKQKKYLDLEVGSDNASVARGIIERMKAGTTDDKTRYVLDSILDSASVNQIVPDSKQYEARTGNPAGASKMQSNMIITYNKASQTGGRGNTINNNGSYQLLSEGPHYALRIKQKDEKDYHTYNINDLLYDRVPKGNSTNDRQKQDVKNSQVASLYKLIGYNSRLGVESFSESVNPIAPEDNGEKRNRLSLALNDYELNFNRAGATQAERDAATNTFIERTKDIGLKSMNKAAFLKH